MRDRLQDLCLYAAAIPMLLVDWVLQALRYGFGRTRITTQFGKPQRVRHRVRDHRQAGPGMLREDAASTL